MRRGGTDIDADAGQVRVRADSALVIMSMVAVPLVFVPDDRHVENVSLIILWFVDLNKQICNCHLLRQQSLLVGVTNQRIEHLLVAFDAEFPRIGRSEEHTSELQSRENLVCRLLLE